MKNKAYNTWYSQAVTHPSTNQAHDCLTSVIRRELVTFSQSKFHSNKSSLTVFFASKEDKDSLSMIQKLSIIVKILSAKDDLIF